MFTVSAVLTLALGIGASTAIFTLVDELILRLLPIQNPQQVVQLFEQGTFYGGNAGYIPARRAAAHDPIQVLRYE